MSTAGNLQADTIIRRTVSVKAGLSADGGVLLDEATDVCYGVNASGIAMWQFLIDPHPLHEVIAFLQSRYPATESRIIDDDVRTFVIAMHRWNLLAMDHSHRQD